MTNQETTARLSHIVSLIEELAPSVGKTLFSHFTFEEGLMEAIEERRFTDLVGELGKLGMALAASPEQKSAFRAEVFLPGPRSQASERFLAELSHLRKWSSEPLDPNFQTRLAEIELQSRHLGYDLGTELFEVIYSPILTPFLADTGWTCERLIASLVALRNFDMQGVEPSPKQVEMLFEHLQPDIAQIDEMMAVFQGCHEKMTFEQLMTILWENRAKFDAVMKDLVADHNLGDPFSWVFRAMSS